MRDTVMVPLVEIIDIALVVLGAKARLRIEIAGGTRLSILQAMALCIHELWNSPDQIIFQMARVLARVFNARQDKIHPESITHLRLVIELGSEHALLVCQGRIPLPTGLAAMRQSCSHSLRLRGPISDSFVGESFGNCRL